MESGIRQDRILDDFEDLSAWRPISSGAAQIHISRDQGLEGSAMRLDFDFRGAGGFVVARKEFSLHVPESYSFGFHLRGLGPKNIFEFKLIDKTDRNVWRYRVESFVFPETWKPFWIRSSQIGFAWGPLGGGPPSQVAAIELVIAAGPGGKGTVWLEGLRFRDDTYRLTPLVLASSSAPGHDPQNIFTPSARTSWRSNSSDEPQWLLIDFQKEREYGGLVIQWEKGFQAQHMEVQVSVDGDRWSTVHTSNPSASERSYLYLPQTVSRYLRLRLKKSIKRRGVAIRSIQVKPYDFSRSLNHFFQHIAREQRNGLYPKYLIGRQTYWTTVGTGESGTQALMNEEGLVEVDKGSFSIEPFLYADAKLLTWADVELGQDLMNRYLPIPSSHWRSDRFDMTITAFATAGPNPPSLYIRYRVVNTGAERITVRLFTAFRPFQVTPVWQNWRSFGGVAPIRELRFSKDAVWVNGNKPVLALTVPDGFGAAAFSEGGVMGPLALGEVPPEKEVFDEFHYASGALRFDLDLAPGSHGEVYLSTPFGTVETDRSPIDLQRGLSGPEQLETALRDWETRLGLVDLQLPFRMQPLADTFKTCAAHILINREGPALHPGPRRYSRSWIRDGAVMGAALLRLGESSALRDFIHWYAAYQTDEGNIPDCVDREGPEWLPEYDAYGEFIYAVVEYYRFTGDKEFLSEMRPAVSKTISFLETLRGKRLTQEYRSPGKEAFYGLLPESMSHEGYMAHPVHAYWDDFWAVRGLSDASLLSEVLGDATEAKRLASLRESLSQDIAASLQRTIARHRIDFVPGSVEAGDFDPTATSVAIGLLDLLPLLPTAETHHTFDKYLEGFRRRASGALDWSNYSAYEIRTIGALVRLGRRRDALEVLGFLLADRRIPAWNQWPEISWRDPRGPSFMGDLPHTWISAEYILAVRTLFAYEREQDQALVIAAGVEEEWLSNGSTVGVKSLPTYYGMLTYSMHLETSDTLCLRLEGNLAPPPGGIVVMPPLPRPLRRVEVNGRTLTDFQPDSFICRIGAAKVIMRF